jgi:hypothetical protein
LGTPLGPLGAGDGAAAIGSLRIGEVQQLRAARGVVGGSAAQAHGLQTPQLLPLLGRRRRRQASQVEQVIELHPLITGRMQTAMLQGMVDPSLAAAGGGAWVAGKSGQGSEQAFSMELALATVEADHIAAGVAGERFEHQAGAM